jgi:thermitase
MPQILLRKLFVMTIILLTISNGVAGLAVGIRSPIRPAYVQSPSTNEEHSANQTDPRGDSSFYFETTSRAEPRTNGIRLDPSWLSDSSSRDTSSGRFGDYGIIGSALANSTELVIGLDSAQLGSYANIMNMIDRVGGKITDKVSARGMVTALVADVPSNAINSLSSSIQASGLARYLEPNRKYVTQSVPNDRDWIEQWGPLKIQADWAWNTTVGNSSILVAVIDTGIDYNHPDLIANYVPLGYNWVNNDTDPMDDNGHGTHCAGIIAATINNSLGIAGLAQVRIMAEKGLDWTGTGYEDDIANAIIHAVDQGANILSNSWGGYESSHLVLDAIRYAHSQGVLVVAAAGNDASVAKHYPAAYDEVIGVTATGRDDSPAWFTNYGDWIELAAPGVEIYSTLRNSVYGLKSGTSMACPHVSGVAALIWSRFPNATSEWIRAQLRATADDLGDSGLDSYYGYGRINARRAVEQEPPGHDLILFNWEKPKYIQPEETGYFNATILNFGSNDEYNVNIQLLIDGNLTESTIISHLTNGASTDVSLPWTPSATGAFNVTLYIVPVENETQTQNNVAGTIFTVRTIIGQVTFEEAHIPSYTVGDNLASDITGGYSEFSDYLTSAGYNVSTIDPGTTIDSSTLGSVSLLVIVAPQLSYSFSELGAIENWVKDGGNLLLISDWGEYGTEARTISERFDVSFQGDGISESDENAGDVPWPYYSGENLLGHIITANISRVEMYGGDGIIDAPSDHVPLIVTDSDGTAYWRNDSSPALRVPVMAALDRGAAGSGRLVVVGDSNIWDSAYDADSDGVIDFYDSDNEILALNTINWFTNLPPHELAVSLEAPEYLKPDDLVGLNATVSNFGLYNETDVRLQLLMNGTLVSNVTIPLLANGTSYTVSFEWAPTIASVFNVTAFAPPLPTETALQNNMNSKHVHVRYPLISPVEGDYANYTTCACDSTGGLLGLGYMNFSYDHYVEPYKIFVNLSYKNPEGPVSSDWMIVNTMTRFVERGGMGGLWYIAWIETNIDAGSSINLLYGSAIVNGSTSIFRNMRMIECWQTPYQMYDLQYEFLHDKASGLWIRMNATNIYTNTFTLIELADTNVPIGTQYPHDLGVWLDAPNYVQPGEATVLNATVWNLGSSSETNIELQLLVNGTVLNSATIPDLATGAHYTLSCAWFSAVRGTYNVTVYASPVPDEGVTLNNVYSKTIIVSYAPKILAYVQYADYYNEYANALKAIESTFGPNYIVTELWDMFQLNSMISGKDVLLIPEQEWASITTLELTGEYWSGTLADFLENGGTIIVCDYNSGYGGTYGILTGASLLSISSAFYRNYYTLYVVDTEDPLTKDVPDSFAAPANTIAFNSSDTKAVVNDGVKPVVIHKKIRGGNVVLLGFDFESPNAASQQILGNAMELAVQIPLSITPSVGSPETETTVTGMRATPNGTVSIYWDTVFAGNTTADSEGSFVYVLTVPADASSGIHEIIAVDLSTARTSSQTFRVIVILLSPTEGTVGTKVTVSGIGFLPETQATVTFNDMLMGQTKVADSGGFTFIFNIPVSNADYQTIKALDGEGNYASAAFTVIEVTSIDIKVDVGATYFLGEVADFYAQAVVNGQPIAATITGAVLYKPDGGTENLIAQRIATGLYKMPYTIVGNETGTYTLVVSASYNTARIRANGTSFKSFLVSNALALLNKQVLEIKDGMALLQTDMGLVSLNLAAINATLENIFLSVTAINGTTATIQTTLGAMNGIVTDIQDHVATILIPGIGSIQSSVSDIMSSQEALTVPTYAILAVALVAAIGAILAVFLLVGKRKAEVR